VSARRLAALLSLAALAAAATEGAQGAPASVKPPRCFGAASRDPRHPCHNPKLDRTVTPRPSEAQLAPNAPCTPKPRSYPYECAFGVAADAAKHTIALIGDSHASHWRAAINPIAEAEHWHGVSLTRTGCPLSSATPVLREPLQSQCVKWKKVVVRWLGAHHDVSTVIVSEHRVHVVHPDGQDPLPTEIAGYRQMWNSLPATVRHVVVIRDTPVNRVSTFSCVQKAMKRHDNAGVALRCRAASPSRPILRRLRPRAQRRGSASWT
jgi:hypothetical protein